MHHGPMATVLIMLAVGLVLTLVLRRIGASALLAYLATGALVAAFVPIEDPEAIHFVGEIGAALLLFALGLELDLTDLRQRLRQIAVATLLQMGLTILVTFAIMSLFNDWRVALTVGCCLALSSTLLVLRSLDESGLRNRPIGRQVIGLLLAQDVMLAPLLVLLSLILTDGGGDDRAPVWLTVVGAVVLLSATVLVRRFIGSRIYARIAATQVPEIEIAFALTIAIGTAFLTDQTGLGAAVGAFCAGLALGSDEHRHAVESSIRPLSGLFAIFFFMSVGLQFDLDYVTGHWPEVLVGLVVAVLLKSIIAAFALRMAGLSTNHALGAGIMVGQVGEFSFVLAASGPLDPDTRRLVIAVACLSLALTPLLIRIARLFMPRSPLIAGLKRGERIVVAGLGPVGNTVVEALHHDGVPLVLIDRNPKLLAPWQGVTDITTIEARIERMEEWLPAMGERPRVVILAFPIPDTSALVAERLLGIDPTLVLIARSPYLSQKDLLYRAGIQHVICDEEATARAIEPLLEIALDDADRRRTARHSS